MIYFVSELYHIIKDFLCKNGKSSIFLLFIVSFPCLINTLNVPDPVFVLVISNRILSFEPLTKDPETSDPELFIIIPWEIVSKVNGDKPVVGPDDPVGIKVLVAEVYDPLATLATNNEDPP